MNWRKSIGNYTYEVHPGRHKHKIATVLLILVVLIGVEAYQFRDVMDTTSTNRASDLLDSKAGY
jgi:hypothetical protein